MKTGIFYKSFLGAAKNYAVWLAEDLKINLHGFNETEKLNNYERVIIISGTYAGWMPLTGFLKRNWKVLKDKKVVGIAVGIAPADDKQSQISYDKIPKEIKKQIKYYKIPGNMFGIKPVGEVKRENLKKIVENLKNK